TLKWARSRSFRLRTTCRLSLSDCAASMRSSRVRKAIIRSLVVGRSSLAKLQRANDQRRTTNDCSLRHGFGRDLLGHEGLNHIADFDVAIVGDGDATFHPVGNLAGIILETAQRSDFALEDNHIVAQQADLGIALDEASGNRASSDRPNLGNAEGLFYLGAALIGFLNRRFQQ